MDSHPSSVKLLTLNTLTVIYLFLIGLKHMLKWLAESWTIAGSLAM